MVAREQSRYLQFADKFRSLTKLAGQPPAWRRAEPEEHFDYVAMLMAARDKESGAPMGERELIDEVMTLAVAGHETTASGLNWTGICSRGTRKPNGACTPSSTRRP